MARIGLTTPRCGLLEFHGISLHHTPGAAGNAWVIVDTDGGLNNGSGRREGLPNAGFRILEDDLHFPPVAIDGDEWPASYRLGRSINVAATGDLTNVWGSSGFVPIGTRPPVYRQL